MKISKNKLYLAGGLFLSAYLLTAGIRIFQLNNQSEPLSLTDEENEKLEAVLQAKYPERNNILRPLPYNVKPFQLDLLCESAIAVDTKSGCILYEKNADEVIPPASMTKIFVMYVVFTEIQKGNLSLDDIIPLPPECWASNMPPHSSLMFLGKNQIVTLRELLAGTSVCSGNDASYALAYHISGSMESFIQRMNDEASKLGLTHTHFVESSGYSELNTTTAREMITFARYYADKFPEAITQFHSLRAFTYPKEHNLAPETKNWERNQDFTQGFPDYITMPITQKNTNPLLGKLEGCDGLKTGYIDESGYNLALTCIRNDMRILSVTMKGPGNTVQEGQQGRIHDGTEIMEWAFSTFKDYENPEVLVDYSIPLAFSTATKMTLTPLYKPGALPVPVNACSNQENPLASISIRINLPKYADSKAKCGQELGTIQYYLNDQLLLETVPLVCTRDAKKAFFWIQFADLLSHLFIK